MNRQVDIKALVSHIVKGDGLDKCRICMGDTSEGQVYLGDTVMMDGDRAVTLAELLEVITGIEVESDLLPNRICGACASNVAPTIKLIEHLRDVDRKWNDASDYILRLELKNNVKTAYIVVDHDVKDVTTYTERARSSVCMEVVYRSFKKRKNQQNAARRKKELNRKLRNAINSNLKCPQCDKWYHNITEYNSHMRWSDQRACIHCRALVKVEDLKGHYAEHDLDTPQCDICSEAFMSKHALLKHTQKYHSKGPYYCYICKLSYRVSNHLAGHMTSIHGPRVCLRCDKKFSNVYCFKTHSNKCKGLERKTDVFICDICAKVYSSKYALKVHLEYVHMNKHCSHQCEHCGKVFNSGIHLLEHSNTHNKVPDRFVCNVCSMPMSSRRGFQRHLKRHIVDPNYLPRGQIPRKLYTCDLCCEQFAFKNQLVAHQMNEHDYTDSIGDPVSPVNFYKPE